MLRSLPHGALEAAQLVREYGALRHAVLDLAEEQSMTLTPHEVRVLFDVLWVSLIEEVTTHDRARAESEQAQVKATVDKLHERESRLSTTLASIGDAVISTDAEGRITFMNRVAEQLTGWSEPEAQGRPMAEVFRILNEHSRQPVASPVDKVLRDGTIVGLANHTLLVRKDGTEAPIDDSAAPIRDARGELLGVVLVFRDISERKRAEREREALVALEQAARAEAEAERTKLRSMFMQAPVAICILEGPEHVYTLANPAYRALVNNRDVVGKTLFDALPDVRGMGFDRLMDQVMATGVTYVAKETPIKLEHHVGDELLYLDFTYAAKRDASGAIDGVLMSGSDVTTQVLARQRVETLAEQLRLSQERLQQVLVASGAGTWEMNITTRVITSDARHRELLGVDPGQPLDLPGAIAAIHPDDRAGLERAVEAALAGENDDHYYALYRAGGRGADAPLRWIESRGRLLRDALGYPLRLIGTSHDITVRIQIEEALRASEERYRTLFESIDDGFCLMQMIVDETGKTVVYRFLVLPFTTQGEHDVRWLLSTVAVSFVLLNLITNANWFFN